MINLTEIVHVWAPQDSYPEEACYLAGLLPKLKHLKRWEQPRDYFGAAWSEYYSAGVGQHRDSDALERSNFKVMWDELGGTGNEYWQGVTKVTENHWAVGWIEWLAIHQSNYWALARADELVEKLQDYPILDEEHYCELEQEEADETWANCYTREERVAYIREHRSQFEFPDFRALLSCVRGDYFAGYASELLHS